MTEAREQRLNDAIEAARRSWGAAAILRGSDRELLVRVGTRYLLKGLTAPATGPREGFGERRPPAALRSECSRS